jgi:hypothetical protein
VVVAHEHDVDAVVDDIIAALIAMMRVSICPTFIRVRDTDATTLFYIYIICIYNVYVLTRLRLLCFFEAREEKTTTRKIEFSTGKKHVKVTRSSKKHAKVGISGTKKSAHMYSPWTWTSV